MVDGWRRRWWLDGCWRLRISIDWKFDEEFKNHGEIIQKQSDSFLKYSEEIQMKEIQNIDKFIEVVGDGWFVEASVCVAFGWREESEEEISEESFAKWSWITVENCWLSNILIGIVDISEERDHWERIVKKSTRLWSHHMLSSAVDVAFDCWSSLGNIKFIRRVDFRCCSSVAILIFSCK